MVFFQQGPVTPLVTNLQAKVQGPGNVLLCWQRPRGIYDGYLVAAGLQYEHLYPIKRLREPGCHQCQVVVAPEVVLLAVRTYRGTLTGEPAYVTIQASAAEENDLQFGSDDLEQLDLREEQDRARLLALLRSLLSRNQRQQQQLVARILDLEQQEIQAREQVQKALLPPRHEKITLRTIKRLQQQLDHLERRLAIVERNIDLQLNLIAKLEDIQAMQLQGIGVSSIDAVILTCEEELAAYLDNSLCDLELESSNLLTTDEEACLASLKAHILKQHSQQASVAHHHKATVPTPVAEPTATVSPNTTTTAERSQALPGVSPAVDQAVDSAPPTATVSPNTITAAEVSPAVPPATPEPAPAQSKSATARSHTQAEELPNDL